MILPRLPQIWQDLAQSVRVAAQGFAKSRAGRRVYVSAGHLRVPLSDERSHTRSPFEAPESSLLSPSRPTGFRVFGARLHRQTLAIVNDVFANFLDWRAASCARFVQSRFSGEQKCHRSRFLSPPAASPSWPGAKCHLTGSALLLAQAWALLAPQRLAATSPRVRLPVPPQARCATTWAFAAKPSGLAFSSFRTAQGLLCAVRSHVRLPASLAARAFSALFCQRTVAHV